LGTTAARARRRRRNAGGTVAGSPALPSRLASPVQAYLDGLLARHLKNWGGEVATYIPELAKADPGWFGICIATVDGAIYEAGETRRQFTLQSISKPLTYGLVLGELGEGALRTRIGVEPTGEAFNAITLSPRRGTPLNPMVNAGAIAAAGLVRPNDGGSRLDRIRAWYGEWAGRPLDVDPAVLDSERTTGHRNRAIAHLLRSTQALDDDPDEALDTYFAQCSISVDARDLAVIGATLAAGGRNPVSGTRVAAPAVVRTVLSVMATCGMYDGAGEWLVDIGLPAKSGVSGGILAVLPGQLGIAVYSPPLDARGNSVRGVAVCRDLTETLDLHLVADRPGGVAPIRTRGDLSSRRSSRTRSVEESTVIAERANGTLVLELQGALTFLAAETVSRTVEERGHPAAIVALDLRRVDRIDGGARAILEGLARTLARGGGGLVIAGGDAVGAYLSSVADPASPPIRRFADLDLALEWIEDRLLNGDAQSPDASTALREHQLLAGLDGETVARLTAYLEMRRWRPGEVVMRRGERADELYLMTAGRATASVELPVGGRRRLSTVCAGGVLGELAFLGAERRTADVHADSRIEAWVLTRDAFDALGRDDPALKATMLENLLKVVVRLARRMTSEVAALAG